MAFGWKIVGGAAAVIAALLGANSCSRGTEAVSVPGETPYKIGYVLALSGTGSVFADPARQGMELALEQINANRAAGRPVSVTIVDDATDPRTAADVCNRLVEQDKVDAIIGYESTPSRMACNQAAQRAGIPYIASSASGGDLCLPNLFQVGMVPNQQMPLLEYLLQKKARRVYLFGSDYSSPKASFARAQALLESKGMTLAGMSFEPLGTSDFSADIAKITAAKPDVVVEAVVGTDGVPFYKQWAADPRTAHIIKASLEMKAATAAAIGEQAAGILIVGDYFPSLKTPANGAFIAAMKQKFGEKAEPSESAVLPYDALHLLAAAVKEAGSTDGSAVISALGKVHFEGPRGSIAFKPGTHYATFGVFIAAVGRDGSLNVVNATPNVEPELSCK